MTTQREQFDTIYDSMINGQRKQAIGQACELGMYEFPELVDYLSEELNQPEVALDFCKSYFRIRSR